MEVSQSTGRWDPWRTSRLLLQEALHGIDKIVTDEEHYFEFSSQTFDRLTDLSVLSPRRVTPDFEIRRYEVPEGMYDLVHAVLDTGPWHAAVAALLEDETSASFPQSRAPSTAAASESLTKLITHEVRNALVPVRHHIDALRAISIDSAVVERFDKARRGVVRVLEFVDELVATNDLFGEPFTSCEVSDVLREAIRLADGGERVELAAGTAARVRVPRVRLVRAIHNIILNALHATYPDGSVRASFQLAHGAVEIMIDDGGAGVPEELRGRVFDEGYTTRGGPGHGFGLAFVRNVVEGALQGKVWCEASPLGGARFVLAIAEDKDHEPTRTSSHRR